MGFLISGSLLIKKKKKTQTQSIIAKKLQRIGSVLKRLYWKIL